MQVTDEMVRVAIEAAIHAAHTGPDDAPAQEYMMRAALTAALAAIWRDGEHPAFFTHEDSRAGHLYYFGPKGRQPGPYRSQQVVKAIIDIADDGTLAGVELIDDMPSPPLPSPPTQTGG